MPRKKLSPLLAYLRHPVAVDGPEVAVLSGQVRRVLGRCQGGDGRVGLAHFGRCIAHRCARVRGCGRGLRAEAARRGGRGARVRHHVLAVTVARVVLLCCRFGHIVRRLPAKTAAVIVRGCLAPHQQRHQQRHARHHYHFFSRHVFSCPWSTLVLVTNFSCSRKKEARVRSE